MVSSLIPGSAFNYPVAHRLCIVILFEEQVNDADGFRTKSTIFVALG